MACSRERHARPVRGAAGAERPADDLAPGSRRPVPYLLGSDNLDVRLGGIYALERIASSSEVDRGPILEVLTAYVRGHSPWPAAGWAYGAATPPEPDDRQLASLQFRKPDVQAMVSILDGARPSTARSSCSPESTS